MHWLSRTETIGMNSRIGQGGIFLLEVSCSFAAILGDTFLQPEYASVVLSQQRSTDRMAHATPVASDIVDLERGECEGRTIAASSHNPKDYAGALRTGGFSRSAGSPQEGRANGASGGILRETEGAERYRNSVETRVSLALGVRGCPKSALPKFTKYFEMLVSAEGLEPSTHALKGHCSTN